MANLTGAYATPVPTISQNTASILKYKARYVTATEKIALPLTTGSGIPALRYIITSIYTGGKQIAIGFSENGTTISDTRFTFAQTAGPLDLSLFFANAPFTQYKNTSYLMIIGEAATSVVAAVVEFKG